MDCKKVRDLLIEFIDEPLYISENSLMQEHLSACKECRQYFIDVQDSLKCINEMGKLEPPLWLSEKIMEKLKGEEKFINLKKIFHIIKMPLQIVAASLIILAFIYIYFYEKTKVDLKAKIENVPKVSILNEKKALVKERNEAEEVAKAKKENVPKLRILAKEKALADRRYKEKVAPEELKEKTLIESEQRDIKLQKKNPIQEDKEVGVQSGILEIEKEPPVHPAQEAPAKSAQETPHKLESYYLREEKSCAAKPAEEKEIIESKGLYLQTASAPKDSRIYESELIISVYVLDLDYASKEIKNIIKETDSELINEEIYNDKRLFSISVNAESLQSIVEGLKKVGEMENLVLDSNKIKGNLKLNIEIKW